jgi:hypothetical protein
MHNQDSLAGFHGVHHNTHDSRERGDPEFPPAQTPPSCSTLTIADTRARRGETVSVMRKEIEIPMRRRL